MIIEITREGDREVHRPRLEVDFLDMVVNHTFLEHSLLRPYEYLLCDGEVVARGVSAPISIATQETRRELQTVEIPKVDAAETRQPAVDHVAGTNESALERIAKTLEQIGVHLEAVDARFTRIEERLAKLETTTTERPLEATTTAGVSESERAQETTPKQQPPPIRQAEVQSAEVLGRIAESMEGFATQLSAVDTRFAASETRLRELEQKLSQERNAPDVNSRMVEKLIEGFVALSVENQRQKPPPTPQPASSVQEMRMQLEELERLRERMKDDKRSRATWGGVIETIEDQILTLDSLMQGKVFQ